MHQACERSPAAPSFPVVAGAGAELPVPCPAAEAWKSIEPAAATTPAFLKSVLRVVSMAFLRSEAAGCMRGQEIARADC